MLEYCQLNAYYKIQWNLNLNSYSFIEENAFENVVCKMVAILSQPQWVNLLKPNDEYMHQWIGS